MDNCKWCSHIITVEEFYKLDEYDRWGFQGILKEPDGVFKFEYYPDDPWYEGNWIFNYCPNCGRKL